MKSSRMFLLFLLFMSPASLAWSQEIGTTMTEVPTQEVSMPQDSPQHAFVTVNGVHVFYYYNDLGHPVYYRLDETGARVFYAATWRPWYMYGGARVYFEPTPYFMLGGASVYYYWRGGSYWYYTYRNGRVVYYPRTWRPYYTRGGARVYYTPRVQYRYNVWRRYSPRVRVSYYRDFKVYQRTHRRYWRRHYRRYNWKRRYNRRVHRRVNRKVRRKVRRTRRKVRRNRRRRR